MHGTRERIVNRLPQPPALGLNALKCELAGEVLRASGSLRLHATGRSMLPAVWPGDTLVIERVNSAAVSEGDIVLFSRGQRLVAHRVTKMYETKVQTQGDSLPLPDAPVAQDELMGKVSAIVRNGKHVEPNRHLRFSERAVAAVLRRSETTARVIVGVHSLRQTSQA